MLRFGDGRLRTFYCVRTSPIQQTTSDDDTGKGYTYFVCHEVLTTENYLVDDNLFLKLELESPSYNSA